MSSTLPDVLPVVVFSRGLPLKPFPRDFVYPRTPHGEGGYPVSSRWDRKKFFLLELGMSVELLSNLVYGSSGGAPVRLVRYTYSVLENHSRDDFSKKLITFEFSPPLLC